MVIRPFPAERRRIDNRDADASLISRIVQWQPRVPLREGLLRTIAFHSGRLEHSL
jgi:hypothetical protein